MLRKIFVFVSFLVISVSAQDHSLFLKGDFERPQDVTLKCLECHDVADDIMTSKHWLWLSPPIKEGEYAGKRLGKRNMINNFCIAITSNEPRCTSCHIGYGWKDDSFDFTDAENIDCLICHDQTGNYVKVPASAGMPADTVDLLASAQSVGIPTNANCGSCHFNGGGGTGVKHGDLDESLLNPSRELDVHMGGLNFQCEDCHSNPGQHHIKGASHASMAAGTSNLSCFDCHKGEIHDKDIINKHIKTVACETCHIPEFAREEPTVVWWDWSKAGEDRGEELNEYGKENYNKKKGEFKWDKNVEPVYAWYNGSAEYYLPGDQVKEDVVKLNNPNGSVKDPNAKIYPFKLMKGKQPYDPVNNNLIVPHLFGKDGYWKTYDWEQASKIGMDSLGLDFSGQVDFIETEMYWPINHMVAPAEDAVKCIECHGVKPGKRINLREMGYKEDPMKIGSRFENGTVK